MSDPLDRFPEFAARVRARLERARAWSRDEGFDRPPPETIAEAQEELEDVLGWAYLAWHRLESLRERLGALEQTPEA